MVKKIKDAKCIRIYGPYKEKGQMVWFVYDKNNKKSCIRNKEAMNKLFDKLLEEVN